MRSNCAVLVLSTVGFVLPACGSAGSDESVEGASGHTAEVIRTYAEIVHASYRDSKVVASELSTAALALVETPSQATHEAAKEAWLASREPYLQTEVYRFYDGPIDNPEDGPEGLMNAWPLDEAYIDYVDEKVGAGIINDTGKEISAAALQELNEQGGEENIATGYHAVEFLLWGQDGSDTGPGGRPYTDYLTDGTGTAANQHRRGQYLKTVSSMLVSHLDTLTTDWAEGGSNYRAEFESLAPEEGLRRILTGMIVLSGFETGGERLQTALDSGSQEDEHSCFSDNTHRDMVQDIQGVRNVWLGTYTRLDGTEVSGAGVRALVEATDAALAQLLDDKIAASLTLANALVPPFDQEIAPTNTEGRGRVEALIVSLREQERLLEEVFTLFKLAVPSVE